MKPQKLPPSPLPFRLPPPAVVVRRYVVTGYWVLGSWFLRKTSGEKASGRRKRVVPGSLPPARSSGLASVLTSSPLSSLDNVCGGWRRSRVPSKEGQVIFFHPEVLVFFLGRNATTIPQSIIITKMSTKLITTYKDAARAHSNPPPTHTQ